MKPAINSYRSCIVVILYVIVALSSTANANDKGEQLRRTMADIALLNGQMAQRKADASGIRGKLSARLEVIKKEALNVQREKKIKTPSDAMGNPRLFYDLLLIAEIEAYIDRYSEKVGYYRVACDRLSYLYQQADDDLKIVSTLSDLKIDALISQAEKIVDGYLPHAQTIVVEPGSLNIESPEKIWASFKTKKK